MKLKKAFILVLATLAAFLLVYFYFLEYRTTVIYGDDLNIFTRHAAATTFNSRINLGLEFGKFRPVNGLLVNFLIQVFQKETAYYYLFNTGIQVINALLLALILNLFLRSFILSFFLGCIFSLSRFALYNMTQLLNGGALEGVALSFCLLSLYFIFRACTGAGLKPTEKASNIGFSILFANLSLYTHERYIVLLLFIVLMLLFIPALTRNKYQQYGLVLAAAGSIGLNIVLKKFVYSIPFFTGTAGTKIVITLSSVLIYLKEALLSIVQLNSGPAYLVGIEFHSLPLPEMALSLIFAAGLFLVWVKFLFQFRKGQAAGKPPHREILKILGISICLFGLLLVPAIISIRMEQRWLQAPLAVFILLNCILYSNMKMGGNGKYILVASGLLFIWVDSRYLQRGAGNMYLIYTEKLAQAFRQAMDNGTIRDSSENLYLWKSRKSEDGENAVKWTIGDGTIFSFYNKKKKTFRFAGPGDVRSFYYPGDPRKNFDFGRVQVIDIEKRPMTDITESYAKTLSGSFVNDVTGDSLTKEKVLYNQEHLVIGTGDFENFRTTGFYPDENGLRWTNGKARIEFLSDYLLKDSALFILNTYMPEACKNVRPQLSIVDQENREIRPVMERRQGDQFIFRFTAGHQTKIRSIHIESETINALPDLRTLSFPFISLEIKNGTGHLN